MSSGGGAPAAERNSNQEDLEQRLGDRMDAALEQRMDTMMGVLSGRLESLLVNALRGVGERRESSGGERLAAGGNQVAPGVQSGTPSGAGMSSIPGRAPAEDQEGLQVSEGFDNPRGELIHSVGVGEEFGGGAVYSSSAAKQFPRFQTPSFKRRWKQRTLPWSSTSRNRTPRRTKLFES